MELKRFHGTFLFNTNDRNHTCPSQYSPKTFPKVSMPTNGGSHDESFTRVQCAEFGHARACAGLLTWKGGFVGTDGIKSCKPLVIFDEISLQFLWNRPLYPNIPFENFVGIFNVTHEKFEPLAADLDFPCVFQSQNV